MPETTKHISTFKHLFFICFVLFALSSCAVKDSIFGLVQAEYAKPANKSQTTARSCSFSQITNQQISTVKQAKIRKQTEPLRFSITYCFAGIPEKIQGYYSKNFSGNSPPKYILYKRLKLDTV